MTNYIASSRAVNGSHRVSEIPTVSYSRTCLHFKADDRILIQALTHLGTRTHKYTAQNVFESSGNINEKVHSTGKGGGGGEIFVSH